MLHNIEKMYIKLSKHKTSKIHILIKSTYILNKKKIILSNLTCI